MTATTFFRDGLIAGENVGEPLQSGFPAVDPGYNADVSLGTLAIYLKLASDAPPELHEAFRAAAEMHLKFFFPDGSLDGSWGSRSFKWSVFGSKTAHGSQMWTWLLGEHDGRFTRAALQNARLMQSMLSGHLLGTGGHHRRSGAPACIHSTWNRADCLANSLHYGPAETQPEEPLPLETPGFRTFLPSVNIFLARTEKLAVSVSAYGYSSGSAMLKPAQPMGGAVSYLWHDGWGPVQVGSQAVYRRYELHNMPEAPGDSPAPSTPCIILTRGEKQFSNVFDTAARLEESADGVKARGTLRSIERTSADAAFSIDYRLEASAVKKTYRVSGLRASETPEVIEPIVIPENPTYETLPDGRGVVIKSETARIALTVENGSAALPDVSPAYMPFPGFYTVQPRIKMNSGDGKAAVKVRLEVD